MSNSNLKFDLETKIDRDGNKYFLAKIKGPFTIDCTDGIAIIAFVALENEEQLQIAPLKSNKSYDE